MQTTDNTGAWLQTFTGKAFCFEDSQPEDIDIIDITHALSNVCRFNGHTREFYSVAQHSVLVSKACAPEDALWGLLHDASEAYMGDLVRPIKHHPDLYRYRNMELSVMFAVCERFGLSMPQPVSVSEADVRVLFTEKRDLLKKEPLDWGWSAEPLPRIIKPWPPVVARYQFIYRYIEITGNKSFDLSKLKL